MAAVTLLPASYFGMTAALDHLNGGGPASPLAGCLSTGCGSTVMSPEAASSATAAPASRAPHTRPPLRARARHTPAARPAATARPAGQGAPPPPPPATSSHPAPRVTKPRPARTSTPPPAPSQRPRATVSYRPEQRWLGGFTGQFTVANDGQRTIGNWQLTVTLPGDRVRDVQGADWSTSGDTLTIQPLHGSGSLRPGSSLTISIVAYGYDDTPASCSINGRTC